MFLDSKKICSLNILTDLWKVQLYTNTRTIENAYWLHWKLRVREIELMVVIYANFARIKSQLYYTWLHAFKICAILKLKMIRKLHRQCILIFPLISEHFMHIKMSTSWYFSKIFFRFSFMCFWLQLVGVLHSMNTIDTDSRTLSQYFIFITKFISHF